MPFDNVIRLFNLSRDWGLQEQCYVIVYSQSFKHSLRYSRFKGGAIVSLKAPKLGIISWIKIFISFLGCSVRHAKDSIHPVKVSTQTCKQEYLLAFGI